MLKYFRGSWQPTIIKHTKCILYTNIRVFIFVVRQPHENTFTANITQGIVSFVPRQTACLYYRSNCTKLICFRSIRLHEYVYSSGTESDQFDPWNRIYTRSAYYMTTNLIQFDSIRFEYHSPRWYHRNQISSIRFSFTLRAELNPLN